MQKYNLIDEIVQEQKDWKITLENSSDEEINFETTAQNLKESIIRSLRELSNIGYEKRMKLRYEKFRKMGEWISK
jgi:acetyl-CoA carboxylase alpha subunit